MKVVLVLCATIAMVAHAQSPDRPAWQAPADASARVNPLKSKPELAAGGKKLFTRACSSCHAAGKEQKGPDLSANFVQNESDGALFWKISNGNSRTGMPAFSSLPEAQRWQLILYVRSLGNAAK